MSNDLHIKLQKLREERDWSKTAVAKKLGIKTVSTYANWEYGIRQPDNNMIREIANLYDVSTDYLLGHKSSSSAKDEEDFRNVINDPELRRWYSELPNSKEEDLRKLRKMWDIIKNEDE
ncbi:helix-turn-helix transcriptional regulator [Sporosarcina sp. 179-K 3D1 HS]|uniref:helix-turn-helix domain-containing protein n=1 Tax=Sporosarcina sp. 179-K 3D1 HS TaxID=3232169 RepID=UPI00399F888C